MAQPYWVRPGRKQSADLKIMVNPRSRPERAVIARYAAMPDNGAYVAAKHGVHGLTRAAAVELGGTGIRVNAIAPGVTRTGMTSAVSDDLLRAVPLGRIAEPGEIAAAAVWLCSPEASYITGSVLVADGGWLAG